MCAFNIQLFPRSSINWSSYYFLDKEFQGNILKIELAQKKVFGGGRGGFGGRGGGRGGGFGGGRGGGGFGGGRGGDRRGGGRGGGNTDSRGGDWTCPNP